MPLPQNHRLLWGAIASCREVGAVTIRRFLEHALTAEDVWTASRATLAATGAGKVCVERFLQWRTTFDLDAFEQLLTRESIDIVLLSDENYPIALKTIHTPPQVLFARGPLPPPVPSIAVIGTRRPTDYGQQALPRLIEPVVQAGIPIISGLALGTDAHAHEVALAGHGYTCGVLGSGVDDTGIYPSRNKRLAARILEAGGCLLSEFPPGTHPRPEYFPIRNRIIAGLVKAVVVIEASLDSGTLITARSALEEGREVLAVPGSMWSDVSRGTHQLIRSGARLCGAADDIFEALNLDRVDSCANAQEVLPLTADERSLFETLTSPLTADELSRLMLWPIGQISQALSMLELKQLVIRLPNQTWGRN